MKVADVRRLERLSDDDARTLDAVLQDARNHLVPAEAWLEPVAARLGEAQVDEERWIYGAFVDDEPVGLLDAQLSSPTPGVVTIQHLAVAAPSRGHGVGRALVETLAMDAKAGGHDWLRACILDRTSAGFWPELDFELHGTEEYRRRLEGLEA